MREWESIGFRVGWGNCVGFGVSTRPFLDESDKEPESIVPLAEETFSGRSVLAPIAPKGTRPVIEKGPNGAGRESGASSMALTIDAVRGLRRPPVWR
jgi:hypothetical protein